MSKRIDPSAIAKVYREEIREEIKSLGTRLRLVGFLSSENSPSLTYAEYTRKGCEDVGIEFDLRKESRLNLEAAIDDANNDVTVHGIIVYYPIFNTGQDAYIKDLVSLTKDVEGLNTYWVRKLYHNERFVDDEGKMKAILPCTPLAIMKLLDAAGCLQFDHQPSLLGKKVTIFNRSEVVGRPLASMMANDGAEVFSFDENGPIIFKGRTMEETSTTRQEALKNSDIVITGVPNRKFPLIQADEIRSDATCINFSTIRNFSDEAKEKAKVFIPRVGPMTVTMALRNTVRLYKNFHGRSVP